MNTKFNLNYPGESEVRTINILQRLMDCFKDKAFERYFFLYGCNDIAMGSDVYIAYCKYLMQTYQQHIWFNEVTVSYDRTLEPDQVEFKIYDKNN